MPKNSKLSGEASGITYDREGIPIDNPTLKGFSRYFNNHTIRGRANVAKLTIATFFGFFFLQKVSTL